MFEIDENELRRRANPPELFSASMLRDYVGGRHGSKEADRMQGIVVAERTAVGKKNKARGSSYRGPLTNIAEGKCS